MARDPYDVLGLSRGADLAQIKAAYRQQSKIKHPDMGGRPEDFLELQAAYDFILKQLKLNQRREQPRTDQSREKTTEAGSKYSGASHQAGAHADDANDNRRAKQKAEREIDEELEALHRTWKAYEEKLRTMRDTPSPADRRSQSDTGMFASLANFIRDFGRNSFKTLALIFAGLISIGTVLVEINAISAIILLCSALGFVFSLALKNDKGGFVSAGLLLFGIATIWLLPVRNALLQYPLATLSVLVCIALIFKFAQQGGTAGLMTGGLLALYLIGVIVTDTLPKALVAVNPSPAPASPIPPTGLVSPTTPAKPTEPTSVPKSPPVIVKSDPPKPEMIPPRTLVAAQGSILKFVAGIPYRLQLRAGKTTRLVALSGSFNLGSPALDVSKCIRSIELSTKTDSTPYSEFEKSFLACDGDAMLKVEAVN